MQKKLHIKKGDTVVVIAGESKGKQGKIVSIDREKGRAIVEAVNMVKKHTKPNAKSPQGGIVEKEASVNISNLMVVFNGKATRVGRKTENGKTIRYSKKSGEVIK